MLETTTLASTALAAGLHFDSGFFWNALLHPALSFLHGLWRTVYLSVVSQLLAVVIGLFIALARRSKNPALSGFARGYIWLIRGTPLLVQLVLIYNGLAAVGLYKFRNIDIAHLVIPGVVQAAIVTLAINESAYMAEIIRAGLAAVDVGQTEAALSIGMTPAQSMRYVVISQAMRFVIPPLGNDFNAMMKNTSILSIIGVEELFLNAQEISSTTFRTFEIFSVAAIYYLFLTTVWSYIQAWIEVSIDRSWGIARTRPSMREVYRRSRRQVSLRGLERRA